MLPLLETYWPLLVAALIFGIVIAWFLFASSRKTRVQADRRDVLDEGAPPAQRNQALIDSKAEAEQLEQAANSQEVAHASAQADAEAGPAIEPTVSTPEDPSPGPGVDGDDLTRIKGLGPKLAAMLQTMGVTRYAQIAEWDDAAVERIDSKLGRFSGRIRRDNWIEQAQLLADGKTSEFDSKFGNS